MSADELTLTITLTRHGNPGAEWGAFVDNGIPDAPGEQFGPTSSPGEVLEAIAEALDLAETEAIVRARAAARDRGEDPDEVAPNTTD